MASANRISDDPAVSVVIATYNRAHYLRETIDSVMQQSFREFELIVVDDGSADSTNTVLESYGDRIRAYHQKNRGPSAARNLGIAQARGQWIAIQDSDDISAPDHLETLLGALEKEPACGMVFANGAYLGGPVHNRETIIPTEKSRRLAEKGVQLSDLFDKSIVRLQAALFSKKYFIALGGLDESLKICMDLDLAFRFYMYYPVKYLNKVVFFYRKHEGNIGRNQDLRLTENIRVIEKLLEDFPRATELLGGRRISGRLAYRYYRLAKNRWKLGDSLGAREAIEQAVSLCPFSIKYRFYQLRSINTH